MDRIAIEGLECSVRVGVPEAERVHPQRILLDLELGMDLTDAGRTDRLEHTVDYAAVCAEVKRLAESRPFRMVEAIAESVAELVLEKFLPAEVRVRVRKFSVPGAGSVGVEILRNAKRGQAPR